MAISYPEILDYRFPEGQQSYGPKDCILYALGTGFGRDPLNEDLLNYVWEQNLRVSPTMAVVLGEDISWSSDPALGLTQSGLLHGEEHLTIHQPLPVAGRIRTHTRMAEVFDLGPGRGALLVMERRIETADGILLAEIRRVEFAREDGGFGGPSRGEGRVTLPALAQMPARAPDQQISLTIDPAAALIYRLSGDPMALHVDPAAARAAGFDQPILHGLATFGHCCQAVLAGAAGFDNQRLVQIGARFSAPVYGGEQMLVSLWTEGPRIWFEANLPERRITAIRGGYATLKES